MANTISFQEKMCHCSNGGTDVLLTVIRLSGSRLAQTDAEKNMIIWLMTKDQSAVGGGTVGFDLVEMPWKKSSFEQQKQFMLRALDRAREKVGWETLDYAPDDRFIFDRLDILTDMFRTIQIEDIDEKATEEWLEDMDVNSPARNGYPMCKEHKIYKSIYGCIACNDR